MECAQKDKKRSFSYWNRIITNDSRLSARARLIIKLLLVSLEKGKVRGYVYLSLSKNPFGPVSVRMFEKALGKNATNIVFDIYVYMSFYGRPYTIRHKIKRINSYECLLNDDLFKKALKEINKMLKE